MRDSPGRDAAMSSCARFSSSRRPARTATTRSSIRAKDALAVWQKLLQTAPGCGIPLQSLGVALTIVLRNAKSAAWEITDEIEMRHWVILDHQSANPIGCPATYNRIAPRNPAIFLIGA
ncbi:MAG: hypothetical protein H6953_12905 [Chromatiaceae bacterium]|nr:hypothetical protein [Chromatiaceae bacterium]MCP5315752.1 hypothetical protein [Chromatiaceae bacterium]